MDLHPKQLVRIHVRTIKSAQGSETVVNRHFSVDPRTITLDRLKHLVARALDVRGEFSVVCHRSEGTQKTTTPLTCDWDLEGTLAEEPRIDLSLELQPEEPGLEEWDIICEADVPVAGHEGSGTPQPRKGSFLEQVLQLCTPHPLGLPLPLTESEFSSLADWPCPLRYAVYRAGGAEPNLRPALWMHLLDVYPAGVGRNDREDFLNRKAEEYYGLRHSWQRLVQAGSIPPVLRDVTNLVRKDVRRTDRPLDLDERALYNVLTTYAVHHPSVGYCQGMSDLLSPLLHVMKTEARAYVALCGLMARMRDNFRRDGRSMRTKFRHLRRALRTHDPLLHQHLMQVGALDLLFCYRWLLLDLKREFPYGEMLRLTEVVWSTLRPAHREKGVELYEVRFPTAGDCRELEPEDVLSEEGHLSHEDTKRRRNTIGRCPSGELQRRTVDGGCPGDKHRRTLDEYNLENSRINVGEHQMKDPQARTVNECKSESELRRTVNECKSESELRRTVNECKSVGKFRRTANECKLEGGLRKTVVNELEDQHGRTVEECYSEDRRREISDPLMRTADELDPSENPRNSEFHLKDAEEASEATEITASDNTPKTRPTPVSLKRWAMLSRRQSIAQNIESEDCYSSSSSTDDEDEPRNNNNNNDGVFRCHNRRRRLRSRNEDLGGPYYDWFEGSPDRRRHGSSDSNYGSNFSEEDEEEDLSSSRSRSEGYDSHRTLTDHSSSSDEDDDDFLNSVDTYCSESARSQQQRLLPAPTRLGDGKPFLVFLCLTMITNHRDAILGRGMDASEVGIYFDRLVRRHRLADVLPRAKELFEEYLRTGWTEDE